MKICTVVIINWNSWKDTERCLVALSKQTFQDFHVHIVDNNSERPPPEALFELFPELSIIQNARNEGFAFANNQIFIQNYPSQWFVLLNPDAFPHPDWLERLLTAGEANPSVAMFGSRLLSAQNPDALDGDGDIYHISGLAWRDRIVKKTHRNREHPFEIFSPCAAAAMYRVDAVRAIGGFDEDFFCYMEDVDLGFRLRLAGHKCLHVPEALAAHVGSASTGGQRSDFAVYHGHRNLVWTYVKNMPGVFFWLFLPLHGALNLVSICWFSLRGQGRVILRAKRDALRGLPKMWRKRRMIQRQREASSADILNVMDKSLIPLKRFSAGK